MIPIGGARGAGAAALAAIAVGAIAGWSAAPSIRLAAATGAQSDPQPHESSAYCGFLFAIAPYGAPTLDAERSVLRSTASVAPPQLRDDYAVSLLAFQQVQEQADGAVSLTDAGVLGTPQLAHSMAAIDSYTVEHCGVHIAQVVPGAES